MFNKDFYPTPEAVILQMLEGYDVTGKTVLEPSAGKGNIIDVLLSHGANVIACENNEDLKKIVQTKCKVIASDFLTVEPSEISHIDFIVMNPPFSADEDHILHAYEIAPAGCVILALCNLDTVKFQGYGFYSPKPNKKQEQLQALIEANGKFEDLGECFKTSERKTSVEVALVTLTKPANGYEKEFEGFFMDDEPEADGSGMMEYNVVRALVNRYVAAVKLYDLQLEQAIQMHDLIKEFHNENYSHRRNDRDEAPGFQTTREDKPKNRADFKKELQKSGWRYIFDKMNMEKYSTKGLKADINEFVEKQEKIPFTMKNIYAMLQLVVGTTSQRMDKALLEVFDKLTEHYAENRYSVEGWKTNSHYLVNRKFIFPYGVGKGYSGQIDFSHYSGRGESVADLEKALCYISGTNYDKVTGHKDINGRGEEVFIKGTGICEVINNTHLWGQWVDSTFFRVRAYKKGTLHCEFKDEKIWADFNQRIAKIKGYPLPEAVKKNAYDQEKRNKKDLKQRQNYGKQAKVLFETDI